MVERYERGIEDGGISAWFERTFDFSSVIYAACAIVCVILAFLVCGSLSGCGGDTPFGTAEMQMHGRYVQVYPMSSGWITYQDPNYGEPLSENFHVPYENEEKSFWRRLPVDGTPIIRWEGEAEVELWEDGVKVAATNIGPLHCPVREVE